MDSKRQMLISTEKEREKERNKQSNIQTNKRKDKNKPKNSFKKRECKYQNSNCKWNFKIVIIESII